MFDMKEKHTRDFGVKNPGLYIEVKDPVWYEKEHQIDMAGSVFKVLQKYGLETIEKSTAAGVPVIFQSFEAEALIQFRKLSDLPLVFMMSWRHRVKSEYYTNFKRTAEICHGVGPNTDWLFRWPDEDKLRTDYLTEEAPFVTQMHEQGLEVHTYTHRYDSPEFTGNGFDETMLYITKGVDGLFTE